MLTAPFIDRSLAAVRVLLAKNQRTADDVARVVLVGGPTLMPGLRARVGEMFGGRIAAGVDPMTIVARGAALYAGSVGLDATPAARAPAPAPGLAVRIEHPSVTADLEPFVVGRCLPVGGQTSGQMPDRVRVERDDGGWTSADAKLSSEGSFVVQVRLDRSRRNGFRVRAFDRGGAEVKLASGTFAIVHGVSVGDPPLARAIGVARADDSTQVYFAKGTPLPARRTFAHHTIRPVAAGSDDDALAVPIVQGESVRAHRNRLIGMLHLRGVSRDLPAGSRIEVTLELDRSGQLATRADVPGTGADVRGRGVRAGADRHRRDGRARALVDEPPRGRRAAAHVPARRAGGRADDRRGVRAAGRGRSGAAGGARGRSRRGPEAAQAADGREHRPRRRRGAAGVARPRRRGAPLQADLHADGRAVGNARRAAAL